jgi:hypothetical protein
MHDLHKLRGYAPNGYHLITVVRLWFAASFQRRCAPWRLSGWELA